MRELSINLESNRKKPLYEQIYEYIREEICRGGIEKGERLPSSRSLSSQLEVSRSTVDLAYAQLVAEGYVEAVPCRGYFACGTGEIFKLDTGAASDITKRDVQEIKYDFDMKPVGIDLVNFPYDTWRKINRDLLFGDRTRLMELGDPKGEPELRESISRYIHQARGVNCSPSQIIVGAGNDYLMMLISFILGTDRTVAMESPGYRHAYGVLKGAGFKTVTVGMDACGMSVDELERSGAQIAYVMPSHQYPMGTVMPVGRRQELIRWAAAAGDRYIIEDDYDSEFRYRGKPIPALQGQAGNAGVLYMGTFSQSLAAAIRISYLVIPEYMADAADEKLSVFSPTVSRIDQTALDTFIREGHFERHLNRMKRIYGRRHDLLVSGLKNMGGEVSVHGEQAGVHLVVSFKNGMTEDEAVALAAEKGVKVYPLSEYVLDGRASRSYDSVLIGYAGLSEPEIKEACLRLQDAWFRN